MYRVWFDDLEKAIAALRKVERDALFCSISGNAYGDFVFEIAEGITYIVKHNDFSVWRNVGDWRNPDWREIK
jgi:hypothetical protein